MENKYQQLTESVFEVMMKNIKNICQYAVAILLISVTFLSSNVSAEYRTTLEDRVEALENYVDTFDPILQQFSLEFEKNIREYTQNLQTNLQTYTSGLENVIDKRFKTLRKKSAVLDVHSSSYQWIETQSGNFMLAVNNIRPVGNGVRLTLDVGNPNYADYKDFSLKLIWGREKPRDPSDKIEYQKWRNSLLVTAYTFRGKLERGMWNEVQINLSPASKSKLGYLEVEMEVSTVELQYKK